MPILEQVPEKKISSAAYLKICATEVTSKDKMISHLCDLADQLRNHILELENLRTLKLAEILASAGSTQASLSPKEILEIQQALETVENEKDRRSLTDELAKREAAQLAERERFNAAYIQVVKSIRDKCYAVSQSDMADYIIETLAVKRTALDRITKLSEETLIPLMKALEVQIASIDEALAKSLDENIFDTVLRLLPDESAVTGLVKKTPNSPIPSAGTKPAAPAAAAGLPDAGQAAKAVTENTDMPKPLSLDTVSSAAGQAAVSAAGQAAASTAGSAALSTSLATAVPEEAALKIAYQTLQRTLSYISESIHVTQKISERIKLQDRLQALQAKYNELQQQHRALSFDIEDLDRLYQFLEQVGAYFAEMEKLDITLTAYADALHAAAANPMAYYGVLLMLIQYMQNLDLYWR